MRIDPQLWTQLAQVEPIGEKLAVRLALPDITERVQCAIDSNKHRHLLIPLDPAEEEFHDAESRGLTVVTRELTTEPRDASTRYIDVECHDASGNDALDIIAGELALAITRSDKEPSKIIEKTLARWRRFWSALPKNILSREEFLGLFGELWFLYYWLIPTVGVVEAVQRWRGPYGARHDFEWPNQSIEVKTTTAHRGRIHIISGIDQLNEPDNGELLFFSLQLREEASAANTLPSLVNVIRSLLEENLEAINDFEILLAHTGYSPAHDEEYEKVRLRIAEEGLFAVNGDFPRITSNTFRTGIPEGVEMLTYEINLNTFNHLRIAGTPEEGTSFLSHS